MKKFKLDISFILVFFCFIFSPYQSLYLKFLILIITHELGHLFFIFIFKANIKYIKIHALGFFISLEDFDSFYKELFISSGGIIINLILIPILNNEFLQLNYLILLFNILPIIPLDGSRMIKSIFANFLPYYLSIKISLIVNFIALVIISIISLSFLDYLVIFNIAYLWLILAKEILDLRVSYEAILLNRYLINYDYKKKYIKFNSRLEYKIYKYKNIYTYINGKLINEREILNYHYRNGK